MKPIEKSKFYKGGQHPYDDCLPSFSVINVIEKKEEGSRLKFHGELVALIPDPKYDEKNQVFKWTLLIEQFISCDNWEDVFLAGKELAVQTIRIAFNNAARPTQDNHIFARARMFYLNDEITAEQLLAIVAQCDQNDPKLIGTMIEKSKSESFRKLIAGLKKA